MHCASCRQSIPDHDAVDAPCPRCGDEVLGEGRWLLLTPWGDGFEAVDLVDGAHSLWPAAGPAPKAAPGDRPPAATVDATDDDRALDELFAAVFPELPAAAPAPAPPSAPVSVRRPLIRRLARRVGVVGASVALAAQLGFATAPAPTDYRHRRAATPGHEALIDVVLGDRGVQRCLAAHRAMPRAQADAPALLQLRSDDEVTTAARVTSVNPVLVGCLMDAADQLDLPAGDYHLAVPITEPAAGGR